MTSKSSFYSRRPGEAPDELNAPSGAYKGADRRHMMRRSQTDRREDVRFELDKEDRRKDKGRREDDNAPSFW